MPFVHDGWMIGWLMQESATLPSMASRSAARARRARDPRVAWCGSGPSDGDHVDNPGARAEGGHPAGVWGHAHRSLLSAQVGQFHSEHGASRGVVPKRFRVAAGYIAWRPRDHRRDVPLRARSDRAAAVAGWRHAGVHGAVGDGDGDRHHAARAAVPSGSSRRRRNRRSAAASAAGASPGRRIRTRSSTPPRDGDLWLQPVPGGAPHRISNVGEGHTVEAPVVSPDGTFVVAVVDQAEVWRWPLDGDGSPERLDDGTADFVFDPFITTCGTTLVWQAWNVPDMAWDASRVQRMTFDGEVRDEFRGSGAIQQMRNMPDGSGICVRDDNGWLNLWHDDAPLVAEQFEHAEPSWSMGQRSFALSPDGDRVAFTRNERGFGRLCVVDVETGAVTEVGRGVHGQVSWSGDRIVALRSGARTPTQIVVYDAGDARAAGARGRPGHGVGRGGPSRTGAGRGRARRHDAARPPIRRRQRAHAVLDSRWSDGSVARRVHAARRVLVVARVGRARARPTADRRVTAAPTSRRCAASGAALDVDDTAAMLRASHDRGWSAPAAHGDDGQLVRRAHRARRARPASGPGGGRCRAVSGDRPRRARHGRPSLRGATTPTRSSGRRTRSGSTASARRSRTPIASTCRCSSCTATRTRSSRSSSTLAFVERMRDGGGDVELVVLEGEGHGFRQAGQPARRLRAHRRVPRAWFPVTRASVTACRS